VVRASDGGDPTRSFPVRIIVIAGRRPAESKARRRGTSSGIKRGSGERSIRCSSAVWIHGVGGARPHRTKPALRDDSGRTSS
jgi:hypothetical protein